MQDPTENPKDPRVIGEKLGGFTSLDETYFLGKSVLVAIFGGNSAYDCAADQGRG